MYNLSNQSFGPPGDETAGVSAAPAPADAAEASPPSNAPAPAATPISSDNPQSASLARFNSCRWQQPAESGNAAFCTHREVKPYAGTAGFDSDAWCPDCQYYKLRRAPKKRSPSDEYSY